MIKDVVPIGSNDQGCANDGKMIRDVSKGVKCSGMCPCGSSEQGCAHSGQKWLAVRG